MTPGPDRDIPVTGGHGGATGPGKGRERFTDPRQTRVARSGAGVPGSSGTGDKDENKAHTLGRDARDARGARDARDDEEVDGEIVDAEIVDDSAAGVPTGEENPEEVEVRAVNATAEAVEEDIVAALLAARREREEYLDALRRVQADFENYRKRVMRQQEDLQSRAAAGLVQDLLPALDAFDLAIAHLSGDEDISPGGLLQAAALLRDTLEKQGLERTGEVGEPFDPTAHEAVEHVEAGPAPDPERSGPTVDEVFRTGFRWKGRVVRPAMVRVRG
ncbi:MAG TPA: nucleotide exchange factor GrpE [Acidimicrobiales bacterium]|nr:nucleotide exchange factor GrpE [Acidimicrobiales bacterium]